MGILISRFHHKNTISKDNYDPYGNVSNSPKQDTSDIISDKNYITFDDTYYMDRSAQLWNDQKWYQDNKNQIEIDYAGLWLGIYKQKIIVQYESMETLMDWLKENGYDSTFIYITYCEVRPNVVIS